MNTKWLLAGVFLLVIVGLTGYGIYDSTQPGEYDTFAQCLNDKGAVFYGAFWCSHCQDQKQMFGKSAELLPYEECSTPDGQGQLQRCSELGIETYPTWEFRDGSRLQGAISREVLAEKTGCELPAE